jgi:hypothetical protein
MTLLPKLEKEIAELRETFTIEIIEDPNFVNLIFKEFPLGEGFNMTTSDLLLRVPRSYPDTGPDMFWTEPTLIFANGQIPQAAESIENHISRSWRRFSWHRQPWNPTIDNLHGHIEFIKRRLRDKK